MASAATAAAESATAGEPSAAMAAESAEPSAVTVIIQELLCVRDSVRVADGSMHMIAQVERGRPDVRTRGKIHIGKEVAPAVIQSGKVRILQFFIDEF